MLMPLHYLFQLGIAIARAYASAPARLHKHARKESLMPFMVNILVGINIASHAHVRVRACARAWIG